MINELISHYTYYESYAQSHDVLLLAHGENLDIPYVLFSVALVEEEWLFLGGT